MGICLDTDQQNGSQVFEESDAQSAGKWRGEAGLLPTPPNGYFSQQNVGPVKFEIPKVPVIFVLGGPGSGKVTHCDNLMQEKKGITHINMMDLLQQYALGNDMQDFGQLSSKTVAEVLMLEIKMSPASKVFLVSGYPRNMRDVVEYAEKPGIVNFNTSYLKEQAARNSNNGGNGRHAVFGILLYEDGTSVCENGGRTFGVPFVKYIKIVNGVILISWRQEVLERQIDFGAQLGQVVIELARMELHNFYRNVMPVIEYFDQSGMLLEVNGERNPNEVYIDFREAVFKILGLSNDNLPQKNIPESLETKVEVENRKESIPKVALHKEKVTPKITQIPITTNIQSPKTAVKLRKQLPSFIWVIGGPGSNKGNLCTQAIRNMPGWVHVNVGGMLRAMASSNIIVNDAIVSGEMVPQDTVMQVVEQQIMLNRDVDGIVIDGYPRDLSQVKTFENKFGQQPPLVLLDCSKLQLGRGRLDDNVSAFKKRLELFRKVSLPMLKALDNENRLTIIDGDTDVPSVQQEFAAALYQLMTQTQRQKENHISDQEVIFNNSDQRIVLNGIPKHVVDSKSTIEKVISDNKNGINTQGVIQIANGIKNNANQVQRNNIARVHNYIGNGTAHVLQNGISHLSNGIILNNNKVAPAVQNYMLNTKDAISKMYVEVDGTQQNLHM